MMMDFTSENVERVVTEFYRQQGELNRECHDWLKRCQVSREAWQIVWPLLVPTQSVHIQFVAANMLNYKISRSLHEVPETELMVLKENLVSTLAKYVAASGPSVIITRLQLSLGAFITNTIGPVWPNPLEELGTIFQPQNFPGISEDHILKLLVQTFAFVPEQTQSVWQHSIRKGEAYRAIQSKGESMFSWLFNIIQTQQNPEVILESLKAMSSWMKMLCVCEWAQVNALVDSLVELCNKATLGSDDTLCELTLEIISGILTDANTHQYPNLVLMILEKVLPLQNCLDVILQRKDMELAVSFYGMYVAIADCHSKLLVEVCDEESSYNKTNSKNRANVLALMDIMLKCTGFPGYYPVDEGVSILTITVWYSIAEDIQAKQSERLKYVRLMQVFEWIYKSLAEILITKSRYPDSDSAWNAEDKEQFRTYRQDIGDCLTYCFDLRGWTMLNELIDLIEKDVQIVEQDRSQYPRLWTEIEALLNGIRVLTENISDETDPLVVEPMKRVFDIIYRLLKLNQEIQIPKVFQAAVECINACSGMFQTYDTVAKNMIGFILEGLFLNEVASTASLALKSLSRDCAKQLAEFAPQILSSCKTALDGGFLSQNDCIRLVYCVGKFLPYLPSDQILSGVNEIFAPSLQILHSISNQPHKPEMKAQLVTILHIMSTLCSSLDCDSDDDDEISDFEGQVSDNNNTSQNQFGTEAQSQLQGSSRATRQTTVQPLISVIEQILPVLVPVTEKWAKDEEAMDALFSILKHTISTVHTNSPMVVEYGIQLILISYRICPSTPATLLAKQILLTLGPGNVHLQCQLLQEMHTLCSESLKNARENLDFTEAYFNFIGLLIKNNASLVNQSGIKLDVMLSVGTEIMNFSEVHTLKAGIYFLQIAIDKAAILNPPLVEYFRSNGYILVRKILIGIGNLVSRSSVHHYADVFLSMNRIFSADWRKWLQESLAPSGFPTPHCTPDAKNKFFLKATRERVNRRAMQDAIGDFALGCRNLSGSDYASMTSKIL